MNIEDIAKPGMPERDWMFILKHLKPHFTMLEWGSGGSTTFFSYFVKKYISFEHSRKWFSHTIRALNKEKRANVVLYWINAPNTDYTEYTNKISEIEDKLDAVLIDGRNRVGCAKKLLEYIDDDCLVFLHDAERPRYNEIYDYYEIIFRTPTLKVLKKNGKNKQKYY